MRFTIRNLCWLTVTVAFGTVLVRLLGLHALGSIGFAFAPLLLTLASSFFQNIEARTRRRAVYVILAVLAALPTLIATVAWPVVGLMVGCAIYLVWSFQIYIFDHLHKPPENLGPPNSAAALFGIHTESP